MANKKMGFEGLAYYGSAGGTASTNLTNCRDITYNIEHEKGETTVRGDSTIAPIKTESSVTRVASIELTLVYDSSDASFTAMETAAAAGSAVAIRTKSYSSGKGYDGDCILDIGRPFPLNGEQVVTFTCTPTLDGNRTPSLNA